MNKGRSSIDGARTMEHTQGNKRPETYLTIYIG